MPKLAFDDLLFPRQNSVTVGPSGYDGPYTDDSFSLHARLLGTNNLNKVDDTTPSVLILLAFLGAIPFAVLRYRHEFYRTFIHLVLAVAAFFLWLGFTIRAGQANAKPKDVTKLGIIVGQVALLTGHTILVDVTITMFRNTIWSVYGHDPYIHYSRHLVNIEHALLYLAYVLQVAGLALIPSPGSLSPPSDTSTRLRLAGSWIAFAIIVINFGVSVFWRIAEFDILLRTLLIWLGWNFLVFLPALYNFCNVAVTDDSAGIVKSKALFYISFGLFHLIYIFWMCAIYLGDRWAPRLRPYIFFRAIVPIPVPEG